MRAFSIALVTLLLAGCGTNASPRVGFAPVAAIDVSTRMSRSDQPPLGLVDCDRDGHLTLAELAVGFTLNQRAITAGEFADADLSKDGKWNEAEFSRFLNHRPVRSWAVSQACPAKSDRAARP